MPVIVATTSIWADVASNLACDGLAEIQTVVPIGGDPHSFEPSFRDRQVLEDADLMDRQRPVENSRSRWRTQE